MKKIIAMLLVLVMALGLASSALAVSWAAPATSSSASPFAIEVIKLGVNGDVTGAKYYTVLTDAAAYNYSNIYFAIKLSVPSYANANAYYGNSGFLSGNKVKVTLTYTNLDAKGEGTYYIPLTDSAQTLWFNSRTGVFDPSWVSSMYNNCGCGDSHIISGVAKGAQGATIKACVGASGKLSDLLIGGSYKVEKKDYYGVVPCINCSVTNLSGFYFHSDCGGNGVFYATNPVTHKVTGVYVVGGCAGNTTYYGALVQFDKVLYGWYPNGVMQSCSTGSCGIVTFTKRAIPVGAKVNETWTEWENSFVAADLSRTQTMERFNEWKNLPEVNKSGENFNQLFYEDSEKKIVPASWATIAPSGLGTQPGFVLPAGSTDYAKVWWSKNYVSGVTSGTLTPVKTVVDNMEKTIYEAYPYNSTAVVGSAWYPVSYGNTWYVKSATSDARLFVQTSANTVNCDYNDASFLNTLNHLYTLLGFTYADVMAGNVYMTEDILLANFGFSISVCDTKTWSPYTAAITVTPVAEVPATGSMSYLGIACIVLAVSAAAIAKRRVRG